MVSQFMVFLVFIVEVFAADFIQERISVRIKKSCVEIFSDYVIMELEDLMFCQI